MCAVEKVVVQSKDARECIYERSRDRIRKDLNHGCEIKSKMRVYICMHGCICQASERGSKASERERVYLCVSVRVACMPRDSRRD